MKKIITLLIALMFAVAANAQLNGVSVEEVAGYQTVYEIKTGLYMPGYGEIRFIEGEYILFGSTDNQFEHSMASIVLGDTKESAVLTLEDLRKIIKKEVKLSNDLVVRGCNGKYTTIIKYPMTVARFKTDGVAGYTDVLWSLRNRFEEAKQAVFNFEESYE